jgi:hypothetical protein
LPVSEFVAFPGFAIRKVEDAVGESLAHALKEVCI